MLREAFRASLLLALLPSFALALTFVAWGLRTDLWRWERPLYAALMIFVTAFPAIILFALIRTAPPASTRKVASFAGAVYFIILAYLAFTFELAPDIVYAALAP